MEDLICLLATVCTLNAEYIPIVTQVNNLTVTLTLGQRSLKWKFTLILPLHMEGSNEQFFWFSGLANMIFLCNFLIDLSIVLKSNGANAPFFTLMF